MDWTRWPKGVNSMRNTATVDVVVVRGVVLLPMAATIMLPGLNGNAMIAVVELVTDVVAVCVLVPVVVARLDPVLVYVPVPEEVARLDPVELPVLVYVPVEVALLVPEEVARLDPVGLPVVV